MDDKETKHGCPPKRPIHSRPKMHWHIAGRTAGLCGCVVCGHIDNGNSLTDPSHGCGGFFMGRGVGSQIVFNADTQNCSAIRAAASLQDFPSVSDSPINGMIAKMNKKFRPFAFAFVFETSFF